MTKQEALLEVRITKVETREEEIPFGTETTQSNEYTKGTTKTLQEGQNGLRRVTMQNVYDTNGAAGADHPFHRDHPGAGEQKGGRWHQEGHEVRCGGIHRWQRSVHLACAGLPLLLTLVWQRP